MRKLAIVATILSLQGCMVLPYSEGGMVFGPMSQGYVVPVVAAPCCRVTTYHPLPAADYLSEQYFYYGPTVSVMLPGMIYGRGWGGAGIYHVRPQQRYNWYGQEEHWSHHGHK